MESAAFCTKKRSAFSEGKGVSCHVTHFTTTDLGSETFYYSGLFAGNNPVKYADPDGRVNIPVVNGYLKNPNIETTPNWKATVITNDPDGATIGDQGCAITGVANVAWSFPFSIPN
jgi:hypothetical protein